MCVCMVCVCEYEYKNKHNIKLQNMQTEFSNVPCSVPTAFALHILDECRTLWGEPERVQVLHVLNVHGASACA